MAVARGVVEPRVVGGAAQARLQVDGLAGHLLRGELARVRHPARGVALHRATFPPGLEVFSLSHSTRILNPLNDLSHSHEIYVIMAGQNFVDPV